MLSNRTSLPAKSLRTAVRMPAVVAKSTATPVPGPAVCKTCGVDLSKAPGGCDKEGRVIGGMGAIPGFGWWPIKAYMPCPALNAAGLDYTRKGQGTNEVLFGGVSLGQSGSKTLDEMKKQADKGINVE